MIINKKNKLLYCKFSIFNKGFYAALDKAYKCNFSFSNLENKESFLTISFQ